MYSFQILAPKIWGYLIGQENNTSTELSQLLTLAG